MVSSAPPRAPAQPQWVSSQVLLCRRCSHHQTTKIKQLAAFAPRDEVRARGPWGGPLLILPRASPASWAHDFFHLRWSTLLAPRPARAYGRQGFRPAPAGGVCAVQGGGVLGLPHRPCRTRPICVPESVLSAGWAGDLLRSWRRTLPASRTGK